MRGRLRKDGDILDNMGIEQYKSMYMKLFNAATDADREITLILNELRALIFSEQTADQIGDEMKMDIIIRLKRTSLAVQKLQNAQTACEDIYLIVGDSED